MNFLLFEAQKAHVALLAVNAGRARLQVRLDLPDHQINWSRPFPFSREDARRLLEYYRQIAAIDGLPPNRPVALERAEYVGVYLPLGIGNIVLQREVEIGRFAVAVSYAHWWSETAPFHADSNAVDASGSLSIGCKFSVDRSALQEWSNDLCKYIDGFSVSPGGGHQE